MKSYNAIEDKEAVISSYKPSDEEKKVYKMVLKHYERSWENMFKPLEEFNNRSLIEEIARNQKLFNTYQKPKDDDPDYQWKCVSSDTEILSSDGWKKIGEIKKGDGVLSYDLKSGRILPDIANDCFQYDYNGKMIHIRSLYLDQLITPNHRTIVKKRARKTIGDKRMYYYEKDWEYVKAEDLTGMYYQVPTAGLYDGDFSIGEDFAELIGWVLTDSWYDKKSNGIYISQSSNNKKNTVDRIRKLLDRVGVIYSEGIYEREYKDIVFNEHVFRLSAKDSITKSIRDLIPDRKPTYKLLSLPLREKKRLLDGLVLGDGVIAKNYLRIKDGQYVSFAQKDINTLIWFQTFLHLMGKTGTINDGIVSIHESDQSGIRKDIKREVEYSGKIWSITTNRTNYIAKRNGKIFITGNSNAVSPATRNKVISIVAHITGTILYPNIYAQNDRQEEDKEAARVMRDLMEWVVDNSKYGMTFLYSVISACVNPAVIIHQEYVETFRKIKEIKDNGSWEEIEQLDETLSGFIQSIVPNDELLIENFYEPDIQKQGYLIWRKIISYDLAERKYSNYANFEYVSPGLEVLYSDQDGTFFEKQTEEDYSVEQVWYYNPFKDLMLLFVNGVLMTKCDNPNPRIDKMLPFAKTIYEPINADGNFFYGKSLVNKLGPDQEVIDVLYQMIIDGTYLNLFKPIAVSGKENIDSSVVVPGKITVLSEETKVNPIDTGNNLTAGYNTKIEVERNMTESSSSVQQQGIATKGAQTAYEISTLEQNAKTMLGLFGKMIGFLVRDLGMLIGTDIIQYLTVGEMKEISGKDTLKFKRFNLDKVVKGRKKTRVIEFDNDIPEQMTEEELEKRSFDLMEEEGDDTEIIKVLPGIFRKRKFLYKVEADGLTVKSDALKRAFNLELYDRAINNPMVDQIAVTRDFLFGSYEESRDKTDEYIKEEQPMAQDMAQQAGIGQSQTTPLINQLTSIGNQTSPRV